MPLYPFWGEGSPTKIRLQEKGYPFSKLSTGGPSQGMAIHFGVAERQPFARWLQASSSFGHFHCSSRARTLYKEKAVVVSGQFLGPDPANGTSEVGTHHLDLTEGPKEALTGSFARVACATCSPPTLFTWNPATFRKWSLPKDQALPAPPNIERCVKTWLLLGNILHLCLLWFSG